MGTFGGAQPIVTDGLVFAVDAANYESYTSGSTTWNNMAGDDNGALTNGPTFNEVYSGGITFDGSDDHILVTGSITNLVNDYSIDIWWDCNDGEPRLYYSRSGGGITISSRNTTKFKLSKFGIADIFIGSCPTDTNIHHIVVIYSSTDGVKVYLDGSLNGSHSNTSNQNSYSNIKIGTAQDGAHDGNIYATKIYNKALSALEVTQNYNALKGRFGL